MAFEISWYCFLTLLVINESAGQVVEVLKRLQHTGRALKVLFKLNVLRQMNDDTRRLHPRLRRPL